MLREIFEYGPILGLIILVIVTEYTPMVIVVSAIAAFAWIYAKIGDKL